MEGNDDCTYVSEKPENSMSIKYEIHSIQNSQGTGEERNFARIFQDAPMTADELEGHIQASCSLTKGDIKATLSALRQQMIYELSNGNRFYIPDIGFFSLSVSTDIPEGKPIEKMRGDYINVRNIKFRPETSLLDEVKDRARFTKADFSTRSQSYTENDLKAKIEDFLTENNCITRRDMELLFQLRQNTALKWLKHFTDTGFLKKDGAKNSPVYFLNNRNGK